MTRKRESSWDVVVRAWPFAGPCGFCGCADKRHRVFDTVADRHAAGDSVALLARDYSVGRYEIRALLKVMEAAK
jgi:hypothetical protein